jgi:methylated-DNA-[protein]-cysteine S-methyltransferase
MPARPPERLFLDRLQTPIGTALLVFDRDGVLCALDWEEREDRMALLLRRQYRAAVPLEPGKAPRTMIDALRAYFAGKLGALDAIACSTGGTPFQRKVWTALRKIPAGRTLSYGTLAARLGMPQAVRAVGHANGANPISVVVPCHRLIGADGSLTGYGGGLPRKRWLLHHEGASFVDRSV